MQLRLHVNRLVLVAGAPPDTTLNGSCPFWLFVELSIPLPQVELPDRHYRQRNGAGEYVEGVAASATRMADAATASELIMARSTT